MTKLGVMVCGHGSRDDEAIDEFAAVAAGLARRLPQIPVESGFLEFARPVIRDGPDALRRRGAGRLPPVRLDCVRALAVDLKLLRAAADRIEAAEARAGRAVPRDETLLLVVG